MATFKGIAKTPQDLLQCIVNHITVTYAVKEIDYSSSNGDGYLSETKALLTTAETVTLTCTVADTGSGSTWTVSGSVSGSLGNATATKEGTDYSSTVVTFSFREGPTRFSVSDVITFDIEAGLGTAWTLNEDNISDSNPNILLEGPGFTGSDPVYLGLKQFTYTTNTHNNKYMRCAGMTGYSSGPSFESQPGYLSTSPNLIFFGGFLKYWMHVTGAYIILMVKNGPRYDSFYLGFGAKYGTDTSLDYPFVMAASETWTGESMYAEWNTWYNTDSLRTSGTMSFRLGTSWERVESEDLSDNDDFRLFPVNGYSNQELRMFNRRASMTRDLQPLGIPMSIVKAYTGDTSEGIYIDLLGCLICASAIDDFFYIKPEDTVVVGSDNYLAFPISPRESDSVCFLLKDD